MVGKSAPADGRHRARFRAPKYAKSVVTKPRGGGLCLPWWDCGT